MIRIALLFALAAGLAAALSPAQEERREPEPALLSAQRAVDAGRLVEAESDARGYLDSHKDSADGHYLLGYILFKADKAKASLDEYTKAGRLRPPSALDLVAMGSDYFLMENYMEADSVLTAALAAGGPEIRRRFICWAAPNTTSSALRTHCHCLRNAFAWILGTYRRRTSWA